MRRRDWQGRLGDVFAAVQGEPFAWGTLDCSILACRCIEAVTGHDPMPDLVGSYDSQIGAMRWLADRGFGSLAEAIDSVLGARKPAAFAQRGDVVALDANTCAVVDLTGEFVIGLSPDTGIVRVPVATALHAWSVG